MRPVILADLIDHLPLDAALWRDIDPDSLWSIEDHLLALIVDHLAAANWQRSGDVRAPQPKPIPRPGVTPAADGIGGTPMTLERAEEWLREQGSWGQQES